MASKYNNQFKQDVLAFYASHPQMSKTQICRDFGISEGTLYYWLKQEQPSGGTSTGATVTVEEHRKLQKRNLELEQENIILKKAAAYFAKDALPKGNTLSS